MIRSQILNNAYFSSANDGSLEQVLKSVGFEKGSATMHQTHSSDISFADSHENYECDGLYTDKKLLPLVVKTADCVPILMESNKRISAIHAGWRGLEQLIFEKSLKVHDISSLSISIGPHARKCCYEVGVEFTKKFKNSIDIVDNKKNELVWQGIGKGYIYSDKPDKKEEKINAIVSKILLQFPPSDY